MKSVKTIRQGISLILAAVIALMQTTGIKGAEEEKLNLHATAAVLMDGDSGRLLYEHRPDQKLPMASTTKIMTCILALESANMEDVVTISSYAASMPDVQLNIRKGEQYRLQDLMLSMMLESHNDSAVAIAEHVGGNVENFASMMNEKARELGCVNTHFVTPNGLDQEDEEGIHSTTARELARIMKYCLYESSASEQFRNITATQSTVFQDTTGKRSFHCSNHNTLLTSMEGAVSGKTGFTGQAGYCYVGAVERENERYIVALLACGWPGNKTWKWSDVRQLIGYGTKNYQHHCYQEFTDTREKLYLVYTDSKNIDKKLTDPGIDTLIIARSGELVGGILIRDGEEIRKTFWYIQNVKAPVHCGDVIGEVSFWIGSEKIARMPICACQTVVSK